MANETLAGWTLLAFTSLFSVINPVSAAPIFVGLTSSLQRPARNRVAVRACLAALAILVVFATAGGAIFALFGITVPAFQLAGGVLFVVIGLTTLYGGREEVPDEEAHRADPSVVPLGIPLIAGPGAISTVMVLVGQAATPPRRLALAGVIALNIGLTHLILVAAPTIVGRIGRTGQQVVGKIMALITTVIGMQFIINGATTVALDVLRAVKGGP
jgi:multiple antibiotic resistance protein